ncbi:ATP-binding protein [Brevibacterium sp.]|uniref:tRNA lysidine(34) synthetase n=1 Tax=Brevibacterium sp. TaxID=1701 RepID=UPI0025C66A7B|nr:ATP-binding protein [Brevibacterium sp.]
MTEAPGAGGAAGMHGRSEGSEAAAAQGTGPRPRLDAASAAIRTALREALRELGRGPGPHGGRSAAEERRGAVRARTAEGSPAPLLLGVSGGADSLALASAAAFLHRRGEAAFLACTVDHGLQEGSAAVARATVGILEEMGLPAVSVRIDEGDADRGAAADPVAEGPAVGGSAAGGTEVGGTADRRGPGTGGVEAAGTAADGGELHGGTGGVEARARRGRYAALARIARAHGCLRADGLPLVLTAHTEDDQAETVLLGLMRGSGPRSLAGMAAAADLATSAGAVRILRPLLGITRAQTRASCAAQRLPFWDDPMNEDPGFARVRARQLLRRFEDELGQGLRPNLARTARLLRDDADCLDAQAAEAYERLREPGAPGLPVPALAELPAAVRSRVLRLWLLDAGASAQELTAEHVRRVDALVGASGGPRRRISVPGALAAVVRGGRLVVEAAAVPPRG